MARRRGGGSRGGSGGASRVQTRVVKSPVGLERLKTGPEYQAGMTLLAAAVRNGAAAALRSSPSHGALMPRDGHRDQPFVLEDTDAGVAVVNTDHGAAITEYGSRHTPPVAPLRRGAQAAGLTLRDTGR